MPEPHPTRKSSPSREAALATPCPEPTCASAPGTFCFADRGTGVRGFHERRWVAANSTTPHYDPPLAKLDRRDPGLIGWMNPGARKLRSASVRAR